MDFLRIAARIAARPVTAGLPKEDIDTWHNQIIKPLRNALNAAQGWLRLNEADISPEAGAAASKAMQDFATSWGPKLSEMLTGIGSVGKAVSDAVVRSRKK
jgi:hypothetical protein